MKRKLFFIIPLTFIVVGGIVLSMESRSFLNEGDIAPVFTAHLSTGESVSLRDYKGLKNVVLFFYPRDFTSGCTKEVCSFRDNFDAVMKYDAVVLGVSFDDHDSHKAFIEKYQLPFPLISDPTESIASMYGAANRLGGLIRGAKRVTYVIDKQGVIRSVLYHEVMIGKHVEGAIEALKKLEESRQIESF